MTPKVTSPSDGHIDGLGSSTGEHDLAVARTEETGDLVSGVLDKCASRGSFMVDPRWVAKAEFEELGVGLSDLRAQGEVLAWSRYTGLASQFGGADGVAHWHGTGQLRAGFSMQARQHALHQAPVDSAQDWMFDCNIAERAVLGNNAQLAGGAFGPGSEPM